MSNRRSFLKTSAAAAAGLGVSTSLSASLLSPSRVLGANDRINVALIGVHSMGWYDLEDILKQSNVELHTLCDVDGSELKNRLGQLAGKDGPKPAITMDYRTVLEDKDIDAVIIGTPDHWHCLPMVEACQAGKHVYVEKPLANSVAEINVMLDAARKYKSLVQVGQQQRSGAHWKSAIEFVKSGQLGTIRQVKFWGNFNYGAGNMPVPDTEAPEGVNYDRWLGPAPKRPFNKNRFHGSWRMFRDYGGGLLSDWGVHLLDMGLWAMDVKSAPKSVQALGGNFASTDRALEMPDTLTVLYEMEAYNMIWEHNGGVETGPYNQHYGVKFIGSKGTLVADRDKWRVFAEGNDDEKRMEAPPEQPSDFQSHFTHCENFVRAIRYGDPLNAEIEYGHRSALYAHLGNIAYWSNNRVVYDEKQRRITSSKKADALLTPAYRAPWKFPSV